MHEAYHKLQHLVSEAAKVPFERVEQVYEEPLEVKEHRERMKWHEKDIWSWRKVDRKDPWY